MIAYINEARLGRCDEWLGTDAEEAADKFARYVQEGCDRSMPKRGNVGNRCPAYWWSDEIAAKRKDCIRKRRLFLRAGTRDGNRDHEREALRQAKKELRIANKASQEKAWRELVSAVETDVWGLPYKIVMKKLNRRPPGAHTAGREVELAAKLFPRCPEVRWDQVPISDQNRSQDPPPPLENDTRPFTIAELLKTGNRLRSGKAPGPDSIHNEVLRIFLKADPDALLSLFNVCWRHATFPKKWKPAKLVLLYKGGGRPLPAWR